MTEELEAIRGNTKKHAFHCYALYVDDPRKWNCVCMLADRETLLNIIDKKDEEIKGLKNLDCMCKIDAAMLTDDGRKMMNEIRASANKIREWDKSTERIGR